LPQAAGRTSREISVLEENGEAKTAPGKDAIFLRTRRYALTLLLPFMAALALRVGSAAMKDGGTLRLSAVRLPDARFRLGRLAPLEPAGQRGKPGFSYPSQYRF